ncbi:hypothetical protein GCM10022281_22310 [Sphingomonas rosea]|uniref:Uncharacterized protein n=1 Tax=Sphingomonas rosea TaxID=335605 RepID=A0ABP7UDD0_9SPHN
MIVPIITQLGLAQLVATGAVIMLGFGLLQSKSLRVRLALDAASKRRGTERASHATSGLLFGALALAIIAAGIAGSAIVLG